MTKTVDPQQALTNLGIFLGPEINVGRVGKLRSIDFQKLIMDKDYVWKLEVLLNSNIEEFEMFYDVSIVLDPKEQNRQLDVLVKKATGKQLNMETITGEIQRSMENIHNEYENNLKIFPPVDFKAGLIKMEKKSGGKQLIQLCVDTEAAIKISKLTENLDKAAIVLKPQRTAHNEDEE